MDRKEFEEKFEAPLYNCIELSEGLVFADKYEFWEDEVALFSSGYFIGRLNLKAIKEVGS